MEKLSESRKLWLQNAVSTFHAALPESLAEEFLAGRGLHDGGDITEQVNKYRLGFVPDHSPGFEQYAGRLAIPYLRRHPRHGWFCIGMKFRRLTDGVDYPPKYEGLPGERTRLYNTQALNAPAEVVGVCEGELDAVTASLCGIPTVGVPGVQNWKPHYRPSFEGYKHVLVFTDGDAPGREFAAKITGLIPNAIAVDCGDGQDVNSLFQSGGVEAVRERLPKID